MYVLEAEKFVKLCHLYECFLIKHDTVIWGFMIINYQVSDTFKVPTGEGRSHGAEGKRFAEVSDVTQNINEGLCG